MLCVFPRFRNLGADGPLILNAGKHLMNLLTLIRTHPKGFPAAAVQGFHRSAKGYLDIMNDLRQAPKPKDHMLLELSVRSRFLGSPALYGCWHDEALNRLLRDVAAGAHGTVHERRILLEFPRAHDNSLAGRTTSIRKRPRGA